MKYCFEFNSLFCCKMQVNIERKEEDITQNVLQEYENIDHDNISNSYEVSQIQVRIFIF